MLLLHALIPCMSCCIYTACFSTFACHPYMYILYSGSLVSLFVQYRNSCTPYYASIKAQLYITAPFGSQSALFNMLRFCGHVSAIPRRGDGRGKCGEGRMKTLNISKKIQQVYLQAMWSRDTQKKRFVRFVRSIHKTRTLGVLSELDIAEYRAQWNVRVVLKTPLN